MGKRTTRPVSYDLALGALICGAWALNADLAQAQHIAGFRAFDLEVAHHDRPVQTAFWYPGDGEGREIAVGENPVFHGTPVVQDAGMRAGRYPVVLMSHGLGGNMRTLSWLSAGLAERGAVVISVNHPNSTTRDFDVERGLQHWTRVRDLQAGLDVALTDPQLSAHLDASQVWAAGFSYGGWTALSMAGMTADVKGYAEHCALVGGASSHCADLARMGVDLLKQDAALWDASYKDTRIRGALVIDPGLHYGVSERNVQNLEQDLLMVSLGAEADRLLATDFSPAGSDFERLVPFAQIENIAPAAHFSALLTCKPKGVYILEEEGEEPVCTDPDGTDRGALHAKIIEAMAQHLGL